MKMNRQLPAILLTSILIVTFAVSVNIVTFATSAITSKSTHHNSICESNSNISLESTEVLNLSIAQETADRIITEETADRIITTTEVLNDSDVVIEMFTYDVANIMIEEEEFVNDIPFNTEQVFAYASFDLSAIIQADEDYIDDIPFDTREISEEFNSGK